jgi:hypothetical protein
MSKVKGNQFIMPNYYRNEYLFSEIYLEEITQIPEQAEVQASLNTLKEYRDYADTSNLKTWKDSFVHQVLYALGFNIQAESENVTLLFPMGSEDHPIAVCYVILPEENLDNTTMGRNWAEKIIRNLREHEKQWGLLTNGEQWRIYHQDEPTPYETYLEIDLTAILADKARKAYQIFHKFMRAENFTSGDDGQCQFDVFKQESLDKIDYIEKELENALKQKEEGGQGVLSSLCMGYVEYLRQNSNPDLEDEELRRKIYHGAMLYMFRLLFLYYADARGLLSDDNHQLLAEVRQAAYEMSHSGNASEKSYRLWQDLETIFVDIDQTYNGGLFNPHESEFTLFIEESKILDLHLTPAVYHLAFYHEKSGEERLISYKDMNIRHFGTLYEGLLEHKLYIASEDTEVKVSKDNIRFIPASMGGKLIAGHFIQKGDIYFGSDKSERKSSGSYYTPEYLVDYIVSNTVGNKLIEYKDDFHLQHHNLITSLSRSLDREKITLSSLLEEKVEGFIEEQILDISVLDPAMGSGHFLVNSANKISNFITEFLNSFDYLSQTKTDTEFWRRRVVENCIFGVDINPLAVELSKLSLWILSMDKDKPLSFLNMHLKQGDSLIGANINDIGRYPLETKIKEGNTQVSLFSKNAQFQSIIKELISKYREIGKLETTRENLEDKKSLLSESSQKLAVYKNIADFHVDSFFDNDIDEFIYQQYFHVIDSYSKERYSAKNYLHWELEFPDQCLYKGGFTCIISNPPYDTFRENVYFLNRKAGRSGNLFAHFIERAIYLNQPKGSIGFVVPLSLACGSSFENVRKLLYKNYEYLYCSHYSKRPNMIFKGVQQRITIFYTKNKGKYFHTNLYSSRLWRWRENEREKVVYYPQLVKVGQIKNGIIPKVANNTGLEIYNLLTKAPFKLGKTIINNKLGDNVYNAYYHSVSMYWIKAYDFIPHFKREAEDNLSISTKLKQLAFNSEFDKNVFLLLVNSSLFYYWWISCGNEFDLLSSEIKDFGVLGYHEMKREQQLIVNYVNHLMNDYKKNSEIKSTSLGGKRVEYQEFYPRKSRDIIYQIDDLIAKFYGLTNKQVHFLKYYDFEYRTN